MTSPRRKQLNHDIRALAHGFLRLDEETYRNIVETISGKRHITDCDDEEANLVLLALKRMKDNTGAGPRIVTNGRQQKFIARLMDYLQWDWSATAAFCEKLTGKKSTKACNAAELSKIIRGMIAVIDHDIEKGKIFLTHTDYFNYLHYTTLHREKSTDVNPPTQPDTNMRGAT